jgi:hypothetical protein
MLILSPPKLEATIPAPHNPEQLASRDSSVSFDFSEFTTVALSFIGTSCAVSDVIEKMRKTYIVPGNDLLSFMDDGNERAHLGELLRKGGNLEIIPCL